MRRLKLNLMSSWVKFPVEKKGIITVRNDAIYVVDFDLLGSIDAFRQKNEPIIDKGGVRIGLVKGLQSSWPALLAVPSRAKPGLSRFFPPFLPLLRPSFSFLSFIGVGVFSRPTFAEHGFNLLRFLLILLMIS